MKKSLLVSGAALVTAAFLGIANAHAFTIEKPGNGASGGEQFAAPDDEAPIQRLTDPKTGKSRGFDFSGTHFNFSVTPGPSQSPGLATGSSRPSPFGPSVGSKNYFDPSDPPPFPSSGFFDPFGNRRR